MWYLEEKNWVMRLNNEQLAITATGIDRMIEHNSLVLRRDRMIAEATHSDNSPRSMQSQIESKN